MPHSNETARERPSQLLCPSAPGRPGESVLIGVVTGTPDAPRVMPMSAPVVVTPELLELASPVTPSEVFRFASDCRACACPHFSNDACQLAVRSVAVLSEVTDKLPPCAIRPQCRWFRQEGPAICKRCPQIVTDQYRPSAEMLRVVYGEDPPALDLRPVDSEKPIRRFTAA
jgi:hypothetical protein